MRYKPFIELINCALTNRVPSKETMAAVSLTDFYDFCCLNKITTLMPDILTHWPIHTDAEKELLSYWQTEATNLVFLEYKKISLVRSLVSLAKEQNLWLLFFKGYILADLYPNYALRVSSDTDLLILPKDIPTITKILNSLGYSHVKALEKKNVSTFLYEEDDYPIHKIELHTSLFEDLDGPRISFLEQLRLATPGNSISLDCCDITITSMPHTNHLIYQIFHMEKHLCCHGFPARYLIDISLFLKRYHAEIDWNLFYTAMKQLGYTTFCRQLFSILVHYFDAPQNILLEMDCCTYNEIEALLIDILQFGARSFSEDLSHFFYVFEQHLENNTKRPCLSVTYDGTTVPLDVVSLKYQQNKQLQVRIQLLQQLNLL